MFEFEKFIKENFKKKGQSGRNYITNCIFCGDKKHMWIELDEKIYHCWKCEAGGNYISFLMAYYDKDYNEVLDIIGTGIVKSVDDLYNSLLEMYDNEYEDEEEIPPIKVQVPDGIRLDKSTAKCKNWIVNTRHYPIHFLKKYGLTFCVKGKYRNRVIIPIQTLNHVTFQAYDVRKNPKKKQLNPKGIPKSNFLYLYNYFRERKYIIIVEGVFDALRLVFFGYPAVAILGKTLSEFQRHLLINSNAKEVIFCLDKDAVDKMLEQAAELKNVFGGIVSYIDLKKFKDPDKVRTVATFDKMFRKRIKLDRESILLQQIKEFGG